MLYIALLIVLASCVGTLAGFGTSTIMIPVMLVFYGLPTTLLLVGIINWFGDIWKLVFFREGIKWDLLLVFGVPGAIAGFISAWIVLSIPRELVTAAIGGTVTAYAVLLLTRPAFKVCQTMPAAVACGASSGFMAGSFGMSGIVRSAFLSGFDLENEVYVAMGGAIALMIDSSRIVAYVAKGVSIEPSLIWGFLIFIPASLIGSMIGRKAVNRISQNKFRKMVAGFLMAAGLNLLLFH